MSAAERLAYVESMREEARGHPEAGQRALASARRYLRRELEKVPAAQKAERFDAAIQETIRKQAAEKKIEIPK